MVMLLILMFITVDDPMIDHHPRHVAEIYEMLTVFRPDGPNMCPV
jgi:hypothetical protein